MGATVMVFTGEYDISHRATIRAQLAVLGDVQDLVLDMTAVTFIDSTCVGELMSMQEHRSNMALRQASIVQGAPSVKRLFDILNLQALFRIAKNLDDVLQKDGTVFAVLYAVSGDDGIPAKPSLKIVTEGSTTLGFTRRTIASN